MIGECISEIALICTSNGAGVGILDFVVRNGSGTRSIVLASGTGSKGGSGTRFTSDWTLGADVVVGSDNRVVEEIVGTLLCTGVVRRVKVVPESALEAVTGRVTAAYAAGLARLAVIRHCDVDILPIGTNRVTNGGVDLEVIDECSLIVASGAF